MAQPTPSFVPITDNAAASRKIRHVQRTDGADTVEEAAVALSEPFLPTYRIASATAVAVTPADSHLLQIFAGASLRVGVRRILVFQVAAANSTSNDEIALYRTNSAGTGGTAVTPVPLDPADSAADCAARLLVSSKGTETTLVDYRQMILHATNTTIGLNPVADFDFRTDKALWLPVNTGLVVKNLTADSSATLRFVAQIVEADWT